jgi:hypothetical protein
MGKSQQKHASKGEEALKPVATCHKQRLASPNSSKRKATAESKQFMDDLFSRSLKASVTADEEQNDSKHSTQEQGKSAGEVRSTHSKGHCVLC